MREYRIRIGSIVIDASKVAAIDWPWAASHIPEHVRQKETGDLTIWFMGDKTGVGPQLSLETVTYDDYCRLRDAIGPFRRVHLMRDYEGNEVARFLLEEVACVSLGEVTVNRNLHVVVVLRSGLKLEASMKTEDVDNLMKCLHWDTPVAIDGGAPPRST